MLLSKNAKQKLFHFAFSPFWSEGRPVQGQIKLDLLIKFVFCFFGHENFLSFSCIWLRNAQLKRGKEHDKTALPMYLFCMKIYTFSLLEINYCFLISFYFHWVRWWLKIKFQPKFFVIISIWTKKRTPWFK